MSTETTKAEARAEARADAAAKDQAARTAASPPKTGKAFTVTDNGDNTLSFALAGVEKLETVASLRLSSSNPNVIWVGDPDRDLKLDASTKALRIMATSAADIKVVVAFKDNSQAAEFLIPCNVISDTSGTNSLVIGTPRVLPGTDATVTLVKTVR
jgi:hypothetical protein